jgi:hypothetical protein
MLPITSNPSWARARRVAATFARVSDPAPFRLALVLAPSGRGLWFPAPDERGFAIAVREAAAGPACAEHAPRRS